MQSKSFRPIIYVRGYAMTQSEVEATVDDPFYGFNLGSTHFRVNRDGGASVFAFESPLLRLITDYEYSDAFSGTRQTAAGIENSARTVWIFRYYDDTSRTFDDRAGGRRLTIEEAAGRLYDFIQHVQKETSSERVYLVAHSMGGLVCRCLLEKVLPERKESSSKVIDKFVTFGTPHGGIEFAVGNGALETARDWLGIKDQDNFGRQRMFEFLTPGKGAKKAPEDFDSRTMRSGTFPPDRVLCIVGTNARDYEVAQGLSRWSVGPQSDGLVQIENAWVHGSHRAYVHRSHSGRFGMVNSEEGYQNLRRFLFGDVKAEASLRDFRLPFDLRTYEGRNKAYHFEVEIAIQSLPMLLHQRTLAHFCPVTLNRNNYREVREKGLPLFTNFLLDGRKPGNKETFSIYLAVHEQQYEGGHPDMAGHLEKVPLWSDYLIVEIELQPEEGELAYTARYSWASESRTPNQPLEFKLSEKKDRADGSVLVPPRAFPVLGKTARLYLETYDWE
jgi:pimeloyl-ACP methyl ester carboxylesterase